MDAERRGRAPLAPDDQQATTDDQQRAGEEPAERRLVEEGPAEGEGEEDAGELERCDHRGRHHAVADRQTEDAQPGTASLVNILIQNIQSFKAPKCLDPVWNILC